MAELESITALHEQLDKLWARYLGLLDQYTNAQHSIKESLGQGFFSLAQANFTSSGRRYGQDYFDQRAVASSRVEIQDSSENLSIKIATLKIEANPGKEQTAHLPTPEPEDAANEAKVAEEPTQLPTPEPEEPRNQEDKSPEEQPRLPSDPLRQFGILIPPALRSAQRSFAKAVQDENSMVQAINSARGMREIEVEIRKMRKVLKKAEKHAGGEVVS